MITVTANKLADFIVAKTPQRRRSIVRQVMRAQHTEKGYAPYYGAFSGPATTFLVDGATDPRVITRALANVARRGKEHGNSRWYKIDTAITTEALNSLLSVAPRLSALNVRFVKPKAGKATLTYPDVTVTVTPDLIVRGERNGVPLFGAARFYLAKESSYQLGPRGAATVATMEYLWCLKSATGSRAPDAGLCMVIETIQQRVTVAPKDIETSIEAIERGCREFAQMWRQLSTEEAA